MSMWALVLLIGLLGVWVLVGRGKELIGNTSLSADFGSVEELYSFAVTGLDGRPRSLQDYRGKVLLIVNTASQCGFTGQYQELENLYNKYRDNGFVVLGFPSNDFGGQEPGSNAEIATFCQLNYGVTFPMFAKGSVSGNSAQPLFSYLTRRQPNQRTRGRILWNFEKFLVDRQGRVVSRYRSITKPIGTKLESKVVDLLA